MKRICTLTPVVVSLLLPMICGCAGSDNAKPVLPPTTLGEAAARRHMYVGAAADSYYLGEAAYSDTLGKEFNHVQPENEMKFDTLHPRPDTDPNPYNFSGADALVAFAQTHNMAIRGHTLVWHSQVPAWVGAGSPTPAQLATTLHNHITHVMGHYSGKVYGWDVVNEAFNDNGTMRDTIWNNQPGIGFAGQGTKYIEQALKWAHTADPKAKLYYNDYGSELLNAKSNAIYAMAQDFKTRGVPLDGIGFQCHFDLGFDTPANITSFTANLKRFADLGLKVHITELDIRLNDSSAASLTAQAKLYGELTTVAVQQPACQLFQVWGFTDKYSWIQSFFPGQGWALPFDTTYQKKAAYTSIFDILK